MEDDAQTLHKEWRAIVLTKLTTLETQVEVVKNEVVSVKLHSINVEDYKALAERVASLEELKNKALAIWAVIQVLTVLGGWLVAFLFK